MPEGIVLWFDEDKGIGFIESIDGEEVFVHHRSIVMEGFRTLAQGDRVTYTIETTRRGAEALDVKKVE